MSSSISLLISGLLGPAVAPGGTGLGLRSELMRRGRGLGGRSGASTESNAERKTAWNCEREVRCVWAADIQLNKKTLTCVKF